MNGRNSNIAYCWSRVVSSKFRFVRPVASASSKHALVELMKCENFYTRSGSGTFETCRSGLRMSVYPKAVVPACSRARVFYLGSSVTKGYPFFCQSASAITTAVTLVKPISLSCLAASVARPPVWHCTYILRCISTLSG